MGKAVRYIELRHLPRKTAATVSRALPLQMEVDRAASCAGSTDALFQNELKLICVDVGPIWLQQFNGRRLIN
jgi:hypothetical protein